MSDRTKAGEVWKFAVDLGYDQVINGPSPMQPIDFAEQKGQLYMWATVIPDNPPTALTIHVVGTGQPIPSEAMWHIGTAHANGGLVWHMFASSKGRVAQNG